MHLIRTVGKRHTRFFWRTPELAGKAIQAIESGEVFGNIQNKLELTLPLFAVECILNASNFGNF